MAVQLILSTDKLQSGFRAKYNSTANAIWINAVDNGDGTVTITKFDTSTITLDLTSSFFTKAEITALLAAIVIDRKLTTWLTPAELADSGGPITVNGIDLTSLDGVVTIDYTSDMIAQLGSNPNVTIWADNQMQRGPTISQDDQDAPTTLVIDTGLTPSTDLVIYLS